MPHVHHRHASVLSRHKCSLVVVVSITIIGVHKNTHQKCLPSHVHNLPIAFVITLLPWTAMEGLHQPTHRQHHNLLRFHTIPDHHPLPPAAHSVRPRANEPWVVHLPHLVCHQIGYPDLSIPGSFHHAKPVAKQPCWNDAHATKCGLGAGPAGPQTNDPEGR
ncbi:hypothetical protein Pelo_18251 [Pelomyxa schiedti]|nr:hypothetical protein Pelo_18251 [Pelomyxa schiedti]